MAQPFAVPTSLPFANAAASPDMIHWFFDVRTNGWFKDQYANTDYNPITVRLYDGDDPNDRVLLLGSEDGYIRYFDNSASKDDDNSIISQVTIGPIAAGNGLEFVLSELQAVTDKNGNVAKYEVLTGDTPEDAVQSEAGTFTGVDGSFDPAGKSYTHNPRRRGYWTYVKVGTTDATTGWALEDIRASIMSIPTDRGRTKTDS